MNYSDYINQIANLIPAQASDPAFAIMQPNMIDDAEQRLYRVLQLENTVTRDASAALSTGTRTFNLPSANGTFVVTQDVNVITPAGTSNPESGTRNPLVPASKEMLDFLYPSANGSSVPQYFAKISQSTIIVGPWPNAAYQVEVVGTFRPQPLSSSNVTTLLSVYFPDLMVSASMVFAAGYMKNYGQAVDDPQQGVSWETHLTKLLESAHTEEMLKKFTSQGWSPNEPAPLATPPRT